MFHLHRKLKTQKKKTASFEIFRVVVVPKLRKTPGEWEVEERRDGRGVDAERVRYVI